MARECELCGKKPARGNNVSHSKRRTIRRFEPNLQSMRVSVNGTSRRIKLCTGCIRTYSKKLVAA